MVDTGGEEAVCAAQDWGGDSQEQEITEEKGQKCRPSKGREEGREDGDKIEESHLGMMRKVQ